MGRRFGSATTSIGFCSFHIGIHRWENFSNRSRCALCRNSDRFSIGRLDGLYSLLFSSRRLDNRHFNSRRFHGRRFNDCSFHGRRFDDCSFHGRRFDDRSFFYHRVWLDCGDFFFRCHLNNRGNL